MRSFAVALAFTAAALFGCGDGGGGGGGGKKKTGKPKRTADVIAEGKAIYEKSCLECHGPEGKGDGPAKGLSLPRPRDFTKGNFKYISTSNKVPTEQDLYDATWKGIPDTQMKAFNQSLSDYEAWAVTYYVQKLAGLEGKTPEVYEVPDKPAGDLKRQGARVYMAQCSKCHGAKGGGDGIASDTLVDDMGDPVPARNLISEVMRGGETPEELFLRIKLGLPGTPMVPPDGYADLSDNDVWAVVEHIQGMKK